MTIVRKKELELEVKQLREQLNKAKLERDKYKKLFDISADALSIIDLGTGRFIECNQSAIDMHGVESSSKFLNLTPSDLSPEFQPCGRRSDEMAGEYIGNTITEGSQVFQWTHTRLDGTTFPCLVSLTYIALDEQNHILAIGRDISELVHTQNQLDIAESDASRLKRAYSEEKEKFEKFVDLATVGIAINNISDGSFEFVNQEFSKITGYSIEELNQMDYWQLTPISYEKQEQAQLESLAEHGHYGPYLKEYIHKNGTNVPVLLSGIKITDRNDETVIWSVVQDMTLQKENEQKIQEAKEKADALALRMQLANDSAEIGIWEWNLRTGELNWDEWMYKLYGINESEFSGAYEAWVNSVHPDDIDSAKSALETAIRGEGVYDPEFRVVHPNGDIKVIKASAEVIRDTDGKAVKVIGVNYDVTEKVNAIQVLYEAKLAAENAVKAKSDFLANMSHEIRTPMNAILGGLQLLQDTKLSRELKTVLSNASFSAQSLLTIINDILDYSKIESNNLQLEHIQFSLTEVLESVKYDLDGQVSNKQVQFIVNKGERYKDYWLGDLVRVKQIILNLASNAVKFTEKGSVKVNIDSRPYSGKDAIYIQVIDSGIGMTEEAAQRIFERFAQADTSTTRKYGGTGLGMSITTNLIKMMGGEIDVQSQLDKGTTVSVILPLQEVDMVSKEKAKKSLSAPDLSSKQILVAEDNAINQVLIQSMLKSTKAKVTIVENGQLAIDEVKKGSYDIVLMDIHMPEMDGVEAQKQLKQLFPKLPVIALTANVMKDDVENYIQQGFVAHIAKPIDINQLYGSLKHFIDK